MTRFPFSRTAIALSFCISGCAALVYQTLWVRQFSLFFGHTTLGISAVLTVFMSGLCIGSLAAPALMRRMASRNALLSYTAASQFGIALIGALSPWLIESAHRGILHFDILTLPLPAQYILWFITAFLILIVPSSLMGLSFPLLMEYNRTNADTASSAGFLYGINTLGAVGGAAACGLFLIPLCGMRISTLIASALSLIAAALLFAARNDHDKPFSRPEDEQTAVATIAPPYVLVALVLTGFAGMACEIAWSRAFALIIGSSTYSFSIVLAVFLAGTAAGSLLLQRSSRSRIPSTAGLGWIMLIAGAGIVLLLPVFNVLPYILVRLTPAMDGNMPALWTAGLAFCVLIMGAPVLCMGASFPWAVAVIDEHLAHPGRSAALGSAFNTVGAIAGSFVAGFIWMPWIGTHATLLAAALVYIIAAAIIWHSAGKLLRPATGITAIILSGCLFFSPAWDPLIMSSGMFLYATSFTELKSYAAVRDALHQNTLLYYRDGLSSTIAVLLTPEAERFLRTNGKTDASASGDRSSQLLIGYIPGFINRGTSRNALLVGLGSGTTLAALAAFSDISHIECVEIEPAMKEAAGFFLRQNRSAYLDPRVRMIYTDARQRLAARSHAYDLIVSEPSNPWIAGIANLYTVEAFTLARNKLSPGGVFCQWVQSYSLNQNDFKMILATFASVFPHTMLFMTQQCDYLIVGATAPMNIDATALRQTVGGNMTIQRDLAILGYSDPMVLIASTFALNDTELRAYSAGAPLHRDDRPTLEFTAPLQLLRSDRTINTALEKNKRAILPEGITRFEPTPEEQASFFNAVGENYMRRKNDRAAERCFASARALTPHDGRSLVNLGRVYNIRNREAEAEDLFRQAIANNPGYGLAYFHLGMLFAVQGHDEQALSYLEKGYALSPDDAMAALSLGRLYKKHNQNARGRRILENALQRPIPSPQLRRMIETELSLIPPIK